MKAGKKKGNAGRKTEGLRKGRRNRLSSPTDSGNPTVRDEKRAERKRQSWETGNPPHKPKGCGTETLHLKLSAPFFYLTIYKSGSARGIEVSFYG